MQSDPMASRRSTKRSRSARARVLARLRDRPRLPELEQRHLDIAGLGLLALAAFFAFGLYWVSRTLFQDVGAHIVFVFLLMAGVLLISGASLAGVLRVTRAGVAASARRIRFSVGEFLSLLVGHDAGSPGPGPRWREGAD